MKTVSCTVWILGALLIISALDTLPDPPVVNPGPSASRILGSHDLSCQTAVPHIDAPVTATLVMVRTVADDVPEPYRPSDGVLLSGQATDPSPPLQQPRRG